MRILSIIILSLSILSCTKFEKISVDGRSPLSQNKDKKDDEDIKKATGVALTLNCEERNGSHTDSITCKIVGEVCDAKKIVLNTKLNAISDGGQIAMQVDGGAFVTFKYHAADPSLEIVSGDCSLIKGKSELKTHPADGIVNCPPCMGGGLCEPCYGMPTTWQKPGCYSGPVNTFPDFNPEHPENLDPAYKYVEKSNETGIAKCSADEVFGKECKVKDVSCVFFPPVDIVKKDTGAVIKSYSAYILKCGFYGEPACASRRSAKENIHYLTEPEREAVSKELLSAPIAKYNYKAGFDDPGENHLGLIIEDVKGSPIVTKDGQKVNLYAYISSVLATVQVQQEQIEKLQKEVEQLKKKEAIDKKGK